VYTAGLHSKVRPWGDWRRSQTRTLGELTNSHPRPSSQASTRVAAHPQGLLTWQRDQSVGGNGFESHRGRQIGTKAGTMGPVRLSGVGRWWSVLDRSLDIPPPIVYGASVRAGLMRPLTNQARGEGRTLVRVYP